MSEWLATQSAGQLSSLAGVTGGVLIAIIAIVAGAWSRTRRAEMRAHQADSENALKQQMIERGMSADEIERVLAAGQSNASKQKSTSEEQVNA